MNAATTKKEDGWKLEKTIPLSVIIVLIGQSIGLIIWAANLSGTVNAQKERMDAFELWRTKSENDVSDLKVNAAGTNTQIDAVNSSLTDIKASQRRIEDILLNTQMQKSKVP